jgi:hypothetical protein
VEPGTQELLVSNLSLKLYHGGKLRWGYQQFMTEAPRWKEHLEDHLELLRCHYNFVRRHLALKFGREVKTPAWQAGLTNRTLTLREIFSSRLYFEVSRSVIFALFNSARPVSVHLRGVSLAA